jgi:hypothetical protein
MAEPQTTTGIPSSNLPFTFAAAVTPSDTVNFSTPTRGLYIGGAGNVVAVMADDLSAVTFIAPPVGTVLNIRATRVNSTSTTATNIVALW